MTLIEFIVTLCTKGIEVHSKDTPLAAYFTKGDKDEFVWVWTEDGNNRHCLLSEYDLCSLYSDIMEEVQTGKAWVLDSKDRRFLAGEENHDHAVEAYLKA